MSFFGQYADLTFNQVLELVTITEVGDFNQIRGQTLDTSNAQAEGFEHEMLLAGIELFKVVE